jgi:Uncharacterized protein conserved in bacteria (DUF2252)
MASDPFVFLRATFFRWVKRIETLLPELAEAPSVLSVGDIHLENFGTWRDSEGRLVWGVNDFDEAAAIPYPFDLVRLAASIRLADEPGLAIKKLQPLSPKDTPVGSLRHVLPCSTSRKRTIKWGCTLTYSMPLDLTSARSMRPINEQKQSRFTWTT